MKVYMVSLVAAAAQLAVVVAQKPDDFPQGGYNHPQTGPGNSQDVDVFVQGADIFPQAKPAVTQNTDIFAEDLDTISQAKGVANEKKDIFVEYEDDFPELKDAATQDIDKFAQEAAEFEQNADFDDEDEESLAQDVAESDDNEKVPKENAMLLAPAKGMPSHATGSAVQAAPSKGFSAGFYGNLTTHTSYSTSTVYSTTVRTYTICETPAATYCSDEVSVVTEVVSLYTTICPITTVTPVSSYSPTATNVPIPMITLTVPTTIYYTVTDCTGDKEDCKIGEERTSISTYTTVRPALTTNSTTNITPPYPTSIPEDNDADDDNDNDNDGVDVDNDVVDVDNDVDDDDYDSYKHHHTSVLNGFPAQTGIVAKPSVRRITTVSGAIMRKSDVLLMTVGLAAAAAVAFLESLW